jgi:hypothetical protein
MAVIGIRYSGCDHDYDDNDERIEIDPSDPEYLKYESVYIHYNHHQGGEKIFDSGNFIKDWFDAKKFFQEELIDKEPYLSGSSTCDHFIMDGAKFESAYLHIIDDNPVLRYCTWVDDSRDKIEILIENREIYEKGWEFFVPEGTKPTWEELKEMCK